MARWELSAKDTSVALTVADNLLCIVFLGQPGKKNFAATPTSVRLPRRYIAGQTKIAPKWEFAQAKEGELEDSAYVELCFRDHEGGLEACSRWEAREGLGAIFHRLRLDNKAGDSAIVYQPEALDVTLGTGEPGEVSYMRTGRVYTEPLCDRYALDLWTKPEGGEDTGFVPLVALRAAGGEGVYIGGRWDSGRIWVRGVDCGGIYAKIKAGPPDDFSAVLAPGEHYEVTAFAGVFSGDIDMGGFLESFGKNYLTYSI